MRISDKRFCPNTLFNVPYFLSSQKEVEENPMFVVVILTVAT